MTSSGIVADFGPMTGVDLQTENVAHIIQLALGPVFLLSGVGITLSMLTQRLSRIVDRARTLEDRRESTANESKLKQIDRDLRVIMRRSRYINSAIALSTTSALLTALVVTLLFASAFTPMSVGGVIAGMFVFSLLCLSTAFLMFLIEVRIATNTLRIGVQKHDK
jgi:CBS domain containing-hemolysin-like protein